MPPVQWGLENWGEMNPSNKPFADALRAALKDREVSFRQLSDLTSAGAKKGLSHTYLSQLANRKSRPTIENMEQIARGLGTDPRYFREYREHVASQEAARLAMKCGLDAVLDKLSELER